ncbi:MAG: radical SAM protein [Deltaproteobacteria bacterium HGW-Deltaproteobacteria-21]|nr:MAG: radical SAM protein [Deltaproteobacteria bacterium HGW-Deltaproteobacteria-21]
MQNTESRKTSSIEKGSTEEKDGKEEFREPGFWETVKEALFGVWRPLDCIQVEVSSRCPGRCIYCPHTTLRDRWRSRNMEISTFSRLWPLMRRSARVHLQGWGEPLLNPAFFDMAVLARKAGCQVSTTTCGLCMNETIALRIIDSGIDIVAFSLAGADAESNRSRLGVDFDRVCEAVSTLQGVRQKHMAVHLEIHFAYLMLASNMEAVRGLPALMKRLGVHASIISTLDYIAGPGLEAEAVGPMEPEKIERAEAILSETSAEAVRMGLGFHYELPDSSADGTSCRENIGRTFFVSADGSISPCVYVNVPAEAADPRRRVFGNVLERDPLAIWESDEYRQFRESLASGRPDRACQSCPKRFMNRNSER